MFNDIHHLAKVFVTFYVYPVYFIINEDGVIIKPISIVAVFLFLGMFWVVFWVILLWHKKKTGQSLSLYGAGKATLMARPTLQRYKLFSILQQIIQKIVFLNSISYFCFVKAEALNGSIIVDGEGALQIIDAIGRVIVDRKDATQTISTSGMAPGVYVLHQISENKVRTQKIVVK